MAYIKKYLENILKARFGEEVRSSIHDAIFAIDDQVVNAENSTIKNAAAAASSATASANSAKAAAQSEANAKQSESLAKQYMESAMDTTPEGYNANMELLHAMDTQTSAENTLYGTRDGGLRLIGMGGGTEQKSYPGYQLFDASKLPTHSAGGVAVTNNGDGSFTISGSGELTEALIITHVISHEETIKMLHTGDVYMNTTAVSYPYFSFRLIGKNNAYFELNNIGEAIKYRTITQEMLDDESLYISIDIWSTVGKTIIPGTIKPMIYQDGDGTWEPFVGAQPSPNPEYKQSINNTGDCVEMIQGYRNATTGIYINGTEFVCNKYPIPCKQGDVFEVECDSVKDYLYALVFNDDTFVTTAYFENTDKFSYTVPSGVTHFSFNVRDTKDITPSTVGKISLTVNGKYVTQIVERRKNLAKFSQASFGTFDENTGMLKSTTTENTNVNAILIQMWNRDTFVSQRKFVDYTGKIVVDFDKSSSFNMLRVLFNSDVKDTYVKFDVSHLTDGITYYIQYNVDKFVANGGTVSNIMITTNPEYDEEYEPYRERISAIFTDGPIRSSDVVFKDDESRLWTVERNVAEEVFDGSDDEKIYKNTTNDSNDYLYFIEPFAKKKKYSNGLCDKLTYKGVSELMQLGGVGFNTNSEYTAIYVNLSDYMSENTRSALKTALSENPITIQYKLATPTYEVLNTASQLALNALETFNGVTYIEIDSRVQPESVEWEYGTSCVSARCIKNELRHDTQDILIEAQNARLDELATALVALGGE